MVKIGYCDCNKAQMLGERLQDHWSSGVVHGNTILELNFCTLKFAVKILKFEQ